MLGPTLMDPSIPGSQAIVSSVRISKKFGSSGKRTPSYKREKERQREEEEEEEEEEDGGQGVEGTVRANRSNRSYWC